MGIPKALIDDWLVRGVGVLREGGCDPVSVVLGAAVDDAKALLDGLPVRIVVATDWADGMGASLRAGLAALDDGARDSGAPDDGDPASGDAVLVTLVDLPDVGADVVRRVLAAPSGSDVLRRAAYDGRPGHPVLLGRDHWAGVQASAVGDQGARSYLAAQEVELVECGDLATGHDVDSRDSP